MIDKFDIFYGISTQTKEKIQYWLYSFVICIFLLMWLDEKKFSVNLSFPTNIDEAYPFVLMVFLLGLAFHIFSLMLFVLIDLKRFKKVKKKYFVKSRILSDSQKDRVLKKMNIKKELCYFVLKRDQKEVNISEKQWGYYSRKIGSRKELLSKMKFLLYIEEKIRSEEALKDDEIYFVNEVIFNSEDLTLYKKMQNDIYKNSK